LNIVEIYSFSAPAIKELEVRRDGLVSAAAGAARREAGADPRGPDGSGAG
jgi:hypothetical protein